MDRHVILMDGAVGTALWALAAERGIPQTPVWQYNLTHPELVSELAGRYVAAGSGLILANTFCANRPMVAKHPGFQPDQVVAAGVRLAKAAVEGRAGVALSVGPLERLPADGPERLAAAAVYNEQLGAGADAGADCILLQTFWDLDLLVLAAEQATRYGLPLFCAMTFGPDGRTYSGDTPADMAAALEPFHPAAIGLNCSCGPADSLAVLEQFRTCTDTPLLFKPNADSRRHGSAAFAAAVAPALECARYVGGCCGTGPEDVAALHRLLLS
ncbi:MAG: hypothetical protein E7426_03995 [Ruminococcaceae bacterium]|nr:hypothetical protein [Oscillospiraceae bacterium]